MRFYPWFKRGLDIFGASTALLLFSPVMLLVTLAVRFRMGSPVLFRQQRPGKDGKPFDMLKFRTMKDDVDARGNPLPDAQRLTRLGRFLRKTSLDELPELFNVLRGDMSLVGPRPLLMQYLPLYTPEQARRHEVRPGITGWAQVNGRNNTTWEKRFEHDLWYVENLSALLDLKILFLTVRAVLCRDGINAEGHATMPEFRGSSSRNTQNAQNSGSENLPLDLSKGVA